MSNLSLYWTPDDFEIDGSKWPGIPLIVDSRTMRLEYLPSEFLFFKGALTAKSRSPLTRRAHAHIMLPFLNHLIENGSNWRHVTEERLAHYRDELERRGTGSSRIRYVMSIICTFYEWAAQRGHLAAVPFTTEAVLTRSNGLLAHIESQKLTSRAVLIPRHTNDQRLPHFYTLDDQQRIREALKNDRDRLIFDWALFTGARENEICNLLVDDIPPQSAYQSRRIYPISITRKRNKRGELYVPTKLLDRTYQYIRFFGRRKTVLHAEKQGIKIAANIFLGRRAIPLKPNSVYKTFTHTLGELGIPGTFHDIRHTFAICTLDKLMQLERYRQDGGRNALLELKFRMGHESLTTTTVYLRAREFYLTDIDSDLWETEE